MTDFQKPWKANPCYQGVRLFLKLQPKRCLVALLVLLLGFSIPQVGAQDVGIDYIDDDTGLVWASLQGNTQQGFKYISIGSGNFNADLSDDGTRIEREFSGLSLGTTYTVSAQIAISTNPGQLLPSGQVVFEQDSDTPSGTCSDGILNQDEVEVDCGGVCPACLTVPDAASNLQASAGAATQINLSWTDNSSNEQGFRVLSGNTVVATLGAGVTSTSIENLSAETEYCYTVVAYNDEGDADASNQACATTPAVDAPETCSDGIKNQNEEDVDCGGVCDACQADETSSEVTIEAEDATLLGSATEYSDTQESGVAYIASNNAGFSIEDAPAADRITVRYASELSGGISIFVNGQDQGNLSFTATGAWVDNYSTASMDVDVPAGATFEVRFQSGDAALNVDKVIFIKEGDAPPTCSDGIQNQDEEDVDCGGPCPACSIIPQPASDATASVISTTQINLSWTDNSNNEDGFNILSGSTVVATVGANVTSRSFTDLSPSTEYCYTVVAYNDEGEANPSNEACATTSDVPAETCSDGIQNQDETGIDCGGVCDACPSKVLVFTKATGFVHSHHDEAIAMITAIGDANGYWETDHTTNSADFTEENLANYDVVIWMSTTGENLLTDQQEEAFENYIKGDGAFVGIHSAIDTYRDKSWPFYNELVGAIVQINPYHTPSNYVGTMDVINSHPSVDFLPNGTWSKADEFYYFELNGGQLSTDNTVTLRVRQTGDNSYDVARPIAWYKESITVDGEEIAVRSAYTGLGNNDVDYVQDATFREHVEGLIVWAGKYEGDAALPTCSDNIQNQGEDDVDCGGPCEACDTDEEVLPVVTATSNRLVGDEGSSKEGFTMYIWDNDGTDGISDCEGGCAQTWPPVLVTSLSEDLIADDLPAGFDGVFGVGGRCNGTYQLTYNDKPLYFYANDDNPGDTNGDQPSGSWHMVSLEAAPTCDDNVRNGDETGVDCGGSCPACEPIVSDGKCEGYGLSYIDGKGILYSEESLGAPCYMCTGPGFNGCNTNFELKDGYYQMEVNVTNGQSYSFGIQCGPNVLVEGTVGDGTSCWLVESCFDGVQNQDETGIDCGGSCGACPTCDDGIQNGDEEGVDCGGSNCSQGCDEVCNGTPNPSAEFSSTNETLENEADGTITFTFDNVEGRSEIEFSIDGGNSYPHEVNDNSGSYTVSDLAPASYELYVRWGNGDCPMSLGSTTIVEGAPKPTCFDGIKNQDEERVDCGGVCDACPDDPCGDIPLVINPRPALATPIIGIQARNSGFAFDLSEDLSSISLTYGEVINIQSGGNPEFEFSCSCNQVQFHTVSVGAEPVAVPQACQDAGDYFYFFRYKKVGYMTDDPGDQYMYSALFTTSGNRINPDNRPTITSKAANWMRFRHPHAYDGITEAIFDAVDGPGVKFLDRYVTEFSDGPDSFIINPLIVNGGSYTEHPHEGPAASVIRIDAMDKGTNPATEYALQRNTDMGGDYNYGQCVNFEITAVAGGVGAQTYNTLQHYFMGVGLDSYGDPRLASAGKASTIMTLPSLETASYTNITRPDQFTEAEEYENYKTEQDAVFTQHLITLTEEDQVDDFLEGHHVFHGVYHRDELPDRPKRNLTLGARKIGDFACGDCHFRDGRSDEVFETNKGQLIAPPVYGVGLLQWIAGAETGLTWDGTVNTVEAQVKNALINDHGIDPDNTSQIDPEDLRLIIDYTKFLTVPSRSGASYDDESVVRGEFLFNEVSCTSCHQTTQKTRSDAPVEFANLVLRPYTDMKKHNVYKGTFRTAPLWGIGRNIALLERNEKQTLFMHDGGATSLEGAVQLHGGDASGSRGAYNNLSSADQTAIINFIKSL